MSKWFFICLTLFGACQADRNYVVKMTKFEVNPDSNPAWGDKGTLRLTQKARNEHVVSGTLYLFKNVGNEILAILAINRISPAGTLIPVFLEEGKLCDYLANEKKMYPSVVEKSNFPSPDTCPFPKGNYTVRDYVVDENQLPDELPSGTYIGSALLKLEQTTVFGFDFGFSVEAK